VVRDSEAPTIEKVWLRLDARAQTAHMFRDYTKSVYGSFLSVHAACGGRRDERMRVPADPKEHRLCLRCSKIHEKEERRRVEDLSNLRQFEDRVDP